MTTNITFTNVLKESDPQQTPVLIIGQLKHLTQLKYDDIKSKIEPRVSEEVSYFHLVDTSLFKFKCICV